MSICDSHCLLGLGISSLGNWKLLTPQQCILPALVYSSDREIEFPKFQFTNKESSRYKQLSKKFASINFSPDGEINREIEFPKITMTIMTN